MSQVDIDSMHSLLAELDDKVDDHLSLILWAISVKSKACILLSDDSLGTSLDRVPVNGLGHLTEGSGGQDGKLLDHLGSGDGGEILDVEMPHNQAQGTGEMESMLNSTLDHNSPTGSSDVMYPPNPNPRCDRCIKKRSDCAGGRPGRRCQRCRDDKKGCKFQNYPLSRKPALASEIRPSRLHFRRPTTTTEVMSHHDPKVQILIKAALEFTEKQGLHSMPK